MKKHRLTIFLIVCLFLFNCSKNKYEKTLIGSWNNFSLDGKSEVIFFEDSIVVSEYSERLTGKWSASKDIIYISPIKSKFSFKENDTLFYKISINKDTLFTKNDTLLSGISYFKLLRVKDN